MDDRRDPPACQRRYGPEGCTGGHWNQEPQTAGSSVDVVCMGQAEEEAGYSEGRLAPVCDGRCFG